VLEYLDTIKLNCDYIEQATTNQIMDIKMKNTPQHDIQLDAVGIIYIQGESTYLGGHLGLFKK
jgi:hypothetical protein